MYWYPLSSKARSVLEETRAAAEAPSETSNRLDSDSALVDGMVVVVLVVVVVIVMVMLQVLY